MEASLADDLGGERVGVLAERDLDLVGAVDDVGVGQQVAVGVDHERGAGRSAAAALLGAEGAERDVLLGLLGLLGLTKATPGALAR